MLLALVPQCRNALSAHWFSRSYCCAIYKVGGGGENITNAVLGVEGGSNNQSVRMEEGEGASHWEQDGNNSVLGA